MAKPQLENGYTKIANELLEALARIRISGEARQVLDVIVRKTYGFNKKKDAISLSQFCTATGMEDYDVCRAIRKLVDMNLIGKIANPIANVYLINKDFSSWKVLAKLPIGHPVGKIAKKGWQKRQFSLAKLPDTKESNKRKYQKKEISSKTRDPEEQKKTKAVLQGMRDDLIKKGIINKTGK